MLKNHMKEGKNCRFSELDRILSTYCQLTDEGGYGDILSDNSLYFIDDDKSGLREIMNKIRIKLLLSFMAFLCKNIPQVYLSSCYCRDRMCT